MYIKCVRKIYIRKKQKQIHIYQYISITKNVLKNSKKFKKNYTNTSRSIFTPDGWGAPPARIPASTKSSDRAGGLHLKWYQQILIIYHVFFSIRQTDRVSMHATRTEGYNIPASALRPSSAGVNTLLFADRPIRVEKSWHDCACLFEVHLQNGFSWWCTP